MVRDPVASWTSVITPLWPALIFEQVSDEMLLVSVSVAFRKVEKSHVGVVEKESVASASKMLSAVNALFDVPARRSEDVALSSRMSFTEFVMPVESVKAPVLPAIDET